MVFLCSKYKLNEINVDTDFLIFDKTIKDKTLTTQGFGLRNTNLCTYINVLVWYNIYYKDHLYLYLMSEKEYEKRKLFPDRMGKLIIQKRIPPTFEDSKNWKYERVREEERLFPSDYDTCVLYLRNKFKEFQKVNLKKELGEVVL